LISCTLFSYSAYERSIRTLIQEFKGRVIPSSESANGQASMEQPIMEGVPWQPTKQVVTVSRYMSL